MTPVQSCAGAGSTVFSPRPNRTADRIARPSIIPTTLVVIPSLYGRATLGTS